MEGDQAWTGDELSRVPTENFFHSRSLEVYYFCFYFLLKFHRWSLVKKFHDNKIILPSCHAPTSTLFFPSGWFSSHSFQFLNHLHQLKNNLVQTFFPPFYQNFFSPQFFLTTIFPDPFPDILHKLFSSQFF